MENLPILTDLYDENKYCLQATGQEDEYVLLKPVRPFARIDFELPAGTSAVVIPRFNSYCAHFRTKVNYFNVLHHEINVLLAETTHGDLSNNERVQRVDAGLEYLELALQRIKQLSGISAEMVHPTEMCIDLLNKFKTLQKPPLKMLAKCLKVCTALLPLADNEIFNRVIHLGILPHVHQDTQCDYEQYALGIGFDSRLLGQYLVDVERKLQRYDFLQAYIGFLRAYTKVCVFKTYKTKLIIIIFCSCNVNATIRWKFLA